MVFWGCCNMDYIGFNEEEIKRDSLYQSKISSLESDFKCIRRIVDEHSTDISFLRSLIEGENKLLRDRIDTLEHDYQYYKTKDEPYIKSADVLEMHKRFVVNSFLNMKYTENHVKYIQNALEKLGYILEKE